MPCCFSSGVARRGSMWYSVEQVWCRALLHGFGQDVVQGRLEHVFSILANQGAYFNSVLNMFIKAPLRYALVVCLHFIPPNHEQMKRLYRQIRKVLAVVGYRYRDLEERERKRKRI